MQRGVHKNNVFSERLQFDEISKEVALCFLAGFYRLFYYFFS